MFLKTKLSIYQDQKHEIWSKDDKLRSVKLISAEPVSQFEGLLVSVSQLGWILLSQTSSPGRC